MNFFEPKRHLPPGWNWGGTKDLLAWCHGLSLLTLLFFVSGYFDARNALYEYIQQLDGTLLRQLAPGRIIAPFWELMKGTPWWGLWFFLGLMAIQVFRHYRWHSQGSMAIYTMRRLPDRWELHRRCWTVPVLASLAELLIFGIGVFLCWLLWRFATPAGHLPM